MYKIIQLAATISVASAAKAIVTSEGKIMRKEVKVGTGNNKDGRLLLKEFERSLPKLWNKEDNDRHGSILDKERHDLSEVAEADQDGNEDGLDFEHADNTNGEDYDVMTQQDYEDQKYDEDLGRTQNEQNLDSSLNEEDDVDSDRDHDQDDNNEGDGDHSDDDKDEDDDEDQKHSTYEEQDVDLGKLAEEDQDGKDDGKDSENGDNTNDEDHDDMKQQSDEDQRYGEDLGSTGNAQDSEIDDKTEPKANLDPNETDDDVEGPSTDEPLDNATFQKMLRETLQDDEDEST